MKQSKEVIRGTLFFLILTLAVGMTAGCKGSDSGGGHGWDNLVSIIARGGEGDTGPGGSGGQVILQASQAGADVEVLPAGGVKLKYSLPLRPSSDLGPDPWVVGHDHTVAVYLNQAAADAGAQDGDHLLLLGDTNLYRKNGAGDYTVISGLKVLEGVVLTLGLNYDVSGEAGEDSAEMILTDDVVINGVLKVATLDTGTLGSNTVELRDGSPATNRDMGSIQVQCHNFFLGGRIKLAGLDAGTAGDRGGYGGALTVATIGDAYLSGSIDGSGGSGAGSGKGGSAAWGPSSAAAIYIYPTNGNLVNHAAIRAEGGRGSDGGSGGIIYLYCVGQAANFGTLNAQGGEGLNGDGGSAGTILLYSATSSSLNFGDIRLHGGDGKEDGVGGPVLGGNGGIFQLISYSSGLNDGPVVVSGGDGRVDGSGGAAGVYVAQTSLPSASFVQRGRIKALGGEATGVGNVGGAGGTVNLIAQGTLKVKGPINFSGGGGDIGGPAGVLTVAGLNGLRLVGYNGGVRIPGGDGASGGVGGGLNIATSGGDVLVKVPLNADAGMSGSVPGGPGGIYSVSGRSISHSGKVSLRGSNNQGGVGSPGGVVSLIASRDLSWLGKALVRGGDAGGSGDYAGGPGGVFVLVGETVKMKGEVRAFGGMAVQAGVGGPGGVVNLIASDNVHSRADLLAQGGGGDATLGTGGFGGSIVLDSSGDPTDHQGKTKAQGGDGAVAGADGSVTIDGLVVWP